jgi:hypothetical protein
MTADDASDGEPHVNVIGHPTTRKMGGVTQWIST